LPIVRSFCAFFFFVLHCMIVCPVCVCMSGLCVTSDVACDVEGYARGPWIFRENPREIANEAQEWPQALQRQGLGEIAISCGFLEEGEEGEAT